MVCDHFMFSWVIYSYQLSAWQDDAEPSHDFADQARLQTSAANHPVQVTLFCR